MKKTKAEAEAMVMVLVTKSKVAPPATSQRFIARPKPMVHNGGIKAVAMATPGRVAERLGLVNAYAAANPPANAMSRSMGLGRVRERISAGNSCRDTKGRARLIRVITNDKRMATKAPRMSAEADLRMRRSSPITEASPMPMMGDMRGASNMAPMITAAELVIKPRVAMLQDKITRRKKSKPGDAEGVISAISFSLSS